MEVIYSGSDKDYDSRDEKTRQAEIGEGINRQRTRRAVLRDTTDQGLAG